MEGAYSVIFLQVFLSDLNYIIYNTYKIYNVLKVVDCVVVATYIVEILFTPSVVGP